MHIYAILCAQSSRFDCLNPCHQVTLVSSCMRHASTCLMLWKASARHSTSMSIHAVYTNEIPCRCAIAHQPRNSIGFSLWKWGIPIAVFSHPKLGENSIWGTMTHQGEALSNFYHKNKAKCYKIFTMEIWQQFLIGQKCIDPFGKLIN